MSIINNLLERWHSPTPKDWKKIQKVCFALGVIGTTITATANYYGWLPDWVYKGCGLANLLGIFIQFLREDQDNDSTNKQSVQ
jgi:hypothetical protein